ncbi:hypothetical protein ACT3SZ_13050 [Corynebacterium sp. AOP40-9SA-29]|uniref:hypothetical protein n=1 Tax=Corynebacterium sp. AOP40-9SA-29 TaxID=3457677 RepID=UPI0040339274
MSTLARRLQDMDHVDPTTAGDIRSFRTTQADIIELDLNPADELSRVTQPRKYQQAILHLIRDERISRERGRELLWDLVDDEDLPEPPIEDESAAWEYVS